MSLKLDDIDYKLLYELSLDGRAPLSKLAHKLGLSKQRIDYRIRRLEDKGVIKAYSAFMDGTSLGFTLYRINLLMANLSEEESKKFLKFLHSLGVVWRVTRLVGHYDYLIDLCVKNTSSLMAFINKLYEAYGEKILGKNVAIAESFSIYLPTLYITEGLDFYPNREEHTISYLEPSLGDFGKFRDEDILPVINLLHDKARLSNTAMSRKLGISLKTFMTLKKHLEGPLIKKYYVEVDGEVLGYTPHKIFLTLNNRSKEAMERIRNFAKNSANIREMIVFTEAWDVELTIDVKTVADLLNFIENLKKDLGDIIAEFDEADIIKVYL